MNLVIFLLERRKSGNFSHYVISTLPYILFDLLKPEIIGDYR